MFIRVNAPAVLKLRFPDRLEFRRTKPCDCFAHEDWPLFAPRLSLEPQRVAFPRLRPRHPGCAVTVDDDPNDLSCGRVAPPEVAHLDPPFWRLRVASQPRPVESRFDLVPKRERAASARILRLCRPGADEVIKLICSRRLAEA